MLITPGTIFKDENNDYVIEELINTGGFGSVYKAKNLSDNKSYAIKTIPNTFMNDKSLESFKNEINMSSHIKSPNVIDYIFAHDGTHYDNLPPYIIMEYASQGTLSKILNTQKQTSEFFNNSQLINMFKQLSNGMSTINEKLVHRDIKPDNILIVDDQLKITDFGLSKISGERTRSMSFKGYGTLKYIAPEAWNNDNNTIHMDIYSMGIVFYELATLKHPYTVKNNDPTSWQQAHLFQVPQDPKLINKNLSPKLSLLILKMLEKSIEKRFSNWDTIIEYLTNDTSDTSDKIDISDILNRMLDNRLEQDTAILKQQTEEKLKQKKDEDFIKLVKYQFETSIVTPLKNIINEFNSGYPNGDIKLSSYTQTRKKNYIRIELISKSIINIEINALLENDYKEVEQRDVFDRYYTVKMEPELNKRKILAWGGLYTDEDTGFNILLVEKENSIYGEWFIMVNTCSAMAGVQRPEPFGFSYDELFEEINYITATHIYNSEVKALDINEFYEFMNHYN